MGIRKANIEGGEEKFKYNLFDLLKSNNANKGKMKKI
jgi:hypothetical protein